jgi:hypothetical protein
LRDAAEHMISSIFALPVVCPLSLLSTEFLKPRPEIGPDAIAVALAPASIRSTTFTGAASIDGASIVPGAAGW